MRGLNQAMIEEYRGHKVLLLGATGFLGAAVGARLRDLGADLTSVSRRAPANRETSTAHFQGDILNRKFIQDAVSATSPARIFHLAGTTPTSGVDAVEMLRTNVFGTVNLLEAVQRSVPKARVVMASSSSVYGAGRGRDTPVDESTPLLPVHEYGASKAAEEMVAVAAGVQHTLSIVRARIFNTVGPGDARTSLSSSVARQVAAAELGLSNEEIHVGWLDGFRDFTDTRDVAAACVMLGARGRTGEAYNVCSGRAVEAREVVERLVGMARVPVTICDSRTEEPDASNVKWQAGTYEKVNNHTGWAPSIPLARSLSDLLDWWRQRLAPK